MRLRERSAVITGGGRGIGEAIANAFAVEGASLTLVARTEAEVAAVADRVRGGGGRAQAVAADVTVEGAAGAVVDRALRAFGRIDILVNCAGVYGPIGLSHQVDEDAWAKAVEINLFGTFRCCRAAVPVMLEQGRGKILNLSGGGATAPLPRFSAYAASKAAVVRLTETLAAELAGSGIDVNSIAPGAIDTRLQDEILAAGDRAGDLFDRMRTMRASGAGATPVSVPAELAVFLASDESNGLTGRLISAPHDPWRDWGAPRVGTPPPTPWYTLRRVDPHTLGPLKDQI